MTETIYQQLRAHVHDLRLTALAEQLAPALEQAERDKPSYTQFLHDLLAHEVAAVQQRRLQGRLRFAKLPARRTLEQFDFSAQPSLDRRLVEDLATLRFIEDRANLLLIGQPGVGKTMLATILGHRAVEAGYRVYYTTAADLVARTAKAAIEGRWATTMRFWNGPQLLIVDELARSCSPPTATSSTGATSSTTPPSPPPSSTGSCTTPPSCPSTATATACAPTKPPSPRCAPRSQVGKSRDHT
jgi:DNA replication protein DnaC